MMMFDVDRLKEAIGEWDRLSKDKDARLSYPLLEIVTAARMMTAGQPLWRCRQHDDDQHGDKTTYCSVNWDGEAAAPCNMVEGWWMPTEEVDGV